MLVQQDKGATPLCIQVISSMADSRIAPTFRSSQNPASLLTSNGTTKG